MKKLLRMIDKIEELHPDLKEYLVVDKRLGWAVIQHPLVYSVPHFEQLNGNVNQHYEYKKQAILKAKQDEKFHHFVWLHERPYRLSAFIQILNDLDDKNYWELLGDIWIDSENIWQNLDTWKNLMVSKRSHSQTFMNHEELDFLNQLPNSFKVYRGCSASNKNGLSYTLDKEKAVWFSKRFDSKGKVIELEVPKARVFAYLNRRSENEIILKLRKVNRVTRA